MKQLLTVGIFVFGIVGRAEADPVTFVLDLGGLPGSEILVNGVATPVPNGLTFTMNVDTSTADTWSPTDFGLFPASSVFFTAPDLGFSNVRIVTPLAYFEDIPPVGTDYARLGLSASFPDSSVNLSLFPPDTPTGAFGDVNVIDVLPSVYGTGNITGPFDFTLETGEYIRAGLRQGWTELSEESQNFGPSSLTTLQAPVPEPDTYALFGGALIAYGLYRRRRKTA